MKTTAFVFRFAVALALSYGAGELVFVGLVAVRSCWREIVGSPEWRAEDADIRKALGELERKK